MAIEIFKILNNIAPPVLSNLVQKRNSKNNFRYSNILQIPQINTTRYGHNYFRYAAPVLWNSLPDEFRLCSNFNHFKTLISSWNGVKRKCAACNKNTKNVHSGQHTWRELYTYMCLSIVSCFPYVAVLYSVCAMLLNYIFVLKLFVY